MAAPGARHLNHVGAAVVVYQVFIPVNVLIFAIEIGASSEVIIVSAILDRSIEEDIVVLTIGNVLKIDDEILTEARDIDAIIGDDTVVVDISDPINRCTYSLVLDIGNQLAIGQNPI